MRTIKKRTLFLLKPGGMKPGYLGNICTMVKRTVEANGFQIILEDYVRLSEKQGLALYHTHEGEWYHPLLAKQVSSCDLYGIVIRGDDVVAIIKRLAGPTKPEEAKSEAPGSIRGQFVIDNYAERKAKGEVVDNICHTSRTAKEAEWEIGVVFPNRLMA